MTQNLTTRIRETVYTLIAQEVIKVNQPYRLNFIKQQVGERYPTFKERNTKEMNNLLQNFILRSKGVERNGRGLVVFRQAFINEYKDLYLAIQAQNEALQRKTTLQYKEIVPVNKQKELAIELLNEISQGGFEQDILKQKVKSDLKQVLRLFINM